MSLETNQQMNENLAVLYLEIYIILCATGFYIEMCKSAYIEIYSLMNRNKSA